MTSCRHPSPYPWNYVCNTPGLQPMSLAVQAVGLAPAGTPSILILPQAPSGSFPLQKSHPATQTKTQIAGPLGDWVIPHPW